MLATACWLSPAPAEGTLRFELNAGPTTFESFTVDSIHARQKEGEGTSMDIGGIGHAQVGALGDVALRCVAHRKARCSKGLATWSGRGRPALTFEFEREPEQFSLTGQDGGRVVFGLPGLGRTELSLVDFPTGWIPSSVLAEIGLSALSGRLSGTLKADRSRVETKLRVRELAFDTPDGRYAGAELALDVGFDWFPDDAGLRLDMNWSAGELLLGPVYIPSPEASFILELEARNLGKAGWRIAHLALDQAQSISLNMTGRIVAGEPLVIAALNLELEQADLASVWRQGLRSLAGTRGWSQLDPGGRFSGRMRIENDSIVSAGLRLSDVTIGDSADRIAVTGMDARLEWDKLSRALEIGSNWQNARLLSIPLGASAVEFGTNAEGTLALVDSFRLPVLDGALVVERLAWRDWARSDRQMVLDARLEPVDLSALTRTLGWTEFGGRLSGNFPGIQLSGGVIDVQGGLDIDLFGGSARINRLSIERPFGSLPALAADIEFDALDLEQVTGAFAFGRMLGLLSGHVTDLRLLDWQPVQFDAWLETLDDSPEREISQKAVDSISSLSGGGSAAISGTLLRWFEDFPYRKAGLGCRLAANVCRMRGLREIKNGGYVILEGRLIPRLDIVGYQRRVDWPRLLSQLAAAAESPE